MFFSRMISCDCVKEMMRKKLKREPVQGVCDHCRKRVERKKLLLCDRCKIPNYCILLSLSVFVPGEDKLIVNLYRPSRMITVLFYIHSCRIVLTSGRNRSTLSNSALRAMMLVISFELSRITSSPSMLTNTSPTWTLPARTLVDRTAET